MNMREEILNNLKIKKLTSMELCKKMHIKGEDNRAAFFSELKKLEEEGLVYKDEREMYQEFNEKRLGKIQGKVHINNAGLGFIKIEKDGKKRKIILKQNELNGALDEDIVIVTDLHKGGHSYLKGKVEKIIKRANHTIFEYIGEGTFIPYNSYGNIQVICPKENLSKLVEGNIVLMNVSNNPDTKQKEKYEGIVKRIVGHKDDPDASMKAIAESKGFYLNFSKEAREELEKIPNSVTQEEIEGRKDLRKEKIFTIDGKDTKDMDDAVGIKKNGDNYVITVSIADVSHYIKKGTALDKEARERGTSLYMADSVVPMLPHKLSNGICSLNPNVDRLTKTVEITINPKGKIISYDLYKSVINSNKKMTYEDVNKILVNNINVEGYEDYIEDLKLMRELTEILINQRKNRGNIDFASNELKINLEEKESDISFETRRQEIAERIVENFMILANQIVTEHFSYMSLPFVYRVHGGPHDDGLVSTLKFLKEEGLCNGSANKLINKINNGTYKARDLREFIDSFKGTENYSIISHYILTNMSRAKYSNINEKHYGLALDYYTHFTSPIRRYPDLIVHRLFDTYEDLMKAYEIAPQIEQELPEICEHASFMERRADDAEEEHMELLMAKVASHLIGKELKGQIVSMTPFGMKIKLENNIRGYVSPEDVSRAKKTLNRTFRLGSNVCTLIKEVSIPHRAIYLKLVDNPENRPKSKINKILKK
ncbi:MAG: ribonuclease R [Bacilli bacterium]|nr:ribonuclease R [Bacilli bacterium]